MKALILVLAALVSTAAYAQPVTPGSGSMYSGGNSTVPAQPPFDGNYAPGWEGYQTPIRTYTGGRGGYVSQNNEAYAGCQKGATYEFPDAFSNGGPNNGYIYVTVVCDGWNWVRQN